MGRSLKYDIPGPDWRRSTLDVTQGGLVELFGDTLAPTANVVLEIGFGRGEFLLDLAARSPETAFLGVEVSFKRVLKMARKLARDGLTNVRLIEDRAETVVRDVIPDDALAEVWINFSDPWPKARHAGRRLIQPDFIAALTPRVRPGGRVHVATDDVPYAEQIHEVLSTASGLESDHPGVPWLPEVSGRMHTGYEREWRAEGRPLHFFEYKRRSVAAGAAA